jgi:hypothetical protein
MKGIVIITVSVFVCSAALASEPIAPGWDIGGRDPASYEVGSDQTSFHSSPESYTIKSLNVDLSNQVNGVFLKSVDATDYKGKRVQITAYVKTEHPDKTGNTSYFYASTGHGSNEVYKWVDREEGWQQVNLVFDVADTTTEFEYGISLWGEGQLWVDDISLSTVDESVALDPGT